MPTASIIKHLRSPAALSALFLAVLAWPVLRMLVAVYEEIGEYSHGYLVPLVAGYAAWQRKDEWLQIPARTSWSGLVLLACGAVIMGLGLWHDVALRPGGLGSEFICGIGLVPAVYGLHLAAFGPARTRVMRFSLLFLLLAVPLPETFSRSVVLPSRTFVSAWSERLIALSSIPITREGNILHLANASLGIEDACSGIRSLWVLITSSVAIGYLLQCRIRHIALIGLLALPLAVLQNLVRVLITAGLVHRFDVSFASGWKHELTGWLTFIVAAAAVVFAAAWLSARYPPPPGEAPGDEPRPGHGPAPLWGMAAVLALVLAGYAAARIHYKPRVSALVEASKARHPLSDIPVMIGGSDFFETLQLPKEQLNILKADDHWVGTFRNRRGRLFSVMLFYWNPQRLGAYDSAFRPHAPDICYPAAGWQPDPEQGEDLEWPGAHPGHLAARLFSQGEENKIVLHWQNELPLGHQQREASGFLRRVRALVRSWNEADMILGRQYSATVDTAAGANSEEARAEALAFATALRDALGPFDMN